MDGLSIYSDDFVISGNSQDELDFVLQNFDLELLFLCWFLLNARRNNL